MDSKLISFISKDVGYLKNRGHVVALKLSVVYYLNPQNVCHRLTHKQPLSSLNNVLILNVCTCQSFSTKHQ